MGVRRVGEVLFGNATSCCKSLGQQGRAVGPLQNGRTPGMSINGISSVGHGRSPVGLSGQGSNARRVLLFGRGCLWG